MNPELLQGFYLGDALVDPHEGMIMGPNGSAHLPPKALEVLLCLASRPGETVSRDELINEVWGEGQASRDTLTHAISAVRHALGDHRSHPVYIQTLPKRGYRLLVEVQMRAANGGPALSTASPHVDALHHAGLLTNLKQRGVLETAIAYLVVGWLLIQFADIVFEQLMFPAWVGTFVTALVIGGFPIAVLLSWFLEFRDGRAVPHELSPRRSSQRRFSRTYLSVIAALTLAGALVFVYDQNVGLPQAVDASPPALPVEVETLVVEPNSFAVIPFENLDGSDDTELFVNGLVDDVIARLSRVPGLLVSSRGDAFTLPAHSPSGSVRQRLRVAHYLAGSVQISGERMRVFVQLIDSQTGFQLLSRQFDRTVDDFFDLLDEITELTVANVRVALPGAAPGVLELSHKDPGLDVYLLYRRGVEAARVAKTPEGFTDAQVWFDRALSIDPDYAAAHAGQCVLYVDAYTATSDAAFVKDAETACGRALSLNPNLDVVYTALGDLYAVTGENESAEDAYLEALGLYEGNVDALIGLGEIYRRQQRPVEAEASLRRATGLHPGDWSAYNALGTFLFRSGRYTEAAEQYRTVVDLDTNNVPGLTNLGSALFLAGEFGAAERQYRRAIDLQPQAPTYQSLGVALYYLGRFDEAAEALREASRLAPLDYLVRSNLGDVLWVSGRRDAAREEFQLAQQRARAALEVNSSDAFILMDLAWIEAVLGNGTEGVSLIKKAKALVPEDAYVYYSEALVLQRADDSEAALSALANAVDLGYPPALIAKDPLLAELRQQGGFGDRLKLVK